MNRVYYKTAKSDWKKTQRTYPKASAIMYAQELTDQGMETKIVSWEQRFLADYDDWRCNDCGGELLDHPFYGKSDLPFCSEECLANNEVN